MIVQEAVDNDRYQRSGAGSRVTSTMLVEQCLVGPTVLSNHTQDRRLLFARYGNQLRILTYKG